MSIIPSKFYQQDDVLLISRALLGKFLMTHIDGKTTGGMITETEAYRAPEDRASHAFDYRRTKRNESMYMHGGISYVYQCYGIHYMFNVVTNVADSPHAILIRAIQPTDGIQDILRRRNKKKLDAKIAGGPGTVAQALGINKTHDRQPLSGPVIWIEDRGVKVPDEIIIASPRVGVDYAGEDALLPWRFRLPKDFKYNDVNWRPHE